MAKQIAALVAFFLSLCVPVSVVAQGTPTGGSTVDLQALFAVVGRMYSVDPALLAAIAAVESGDRSEALSPAGAMGLMQLTPATARRFHVANAFDPVSSALGAARFLAYLKRQQATAQAPNLPTMIAAYNAGEGAVERYRGVPPYPETVHYVRKVLWHYLVDEPIASDAKVPTAVPARDDDAALLEQLARLRRERYIAGRPGAPSKGYRRGDN